MPTIYLTTFIHAKPEILFDLSRNIDLHQISTQHTHEKVVAGRMSGLIELGESVTWRAKHFGFFQELTSRITAFDKPHSFTDEMVKGASYGLMILFYSSALQQFRCITHNFTIA